MRFILLFKIISDKLLVGASKPRVDEEGALGSPQFWGISVCGSTSGMVGSRHVIKRCKLVNVFSDRSVDDVPCGL